MANTTPSIADVLYNQYEMAYELGPSFRVEERSRYCLLDGRTGTNIVSSFVYPREKLGLQEAVENRRFKTVKVDHDRLGQKKYTQRGY